MALFTIADLHLPGKEGKNKSMEIFGSRWIGGVEKLIYNWNAVVKPEDTVVLPGDISWAMMLEDAKEDFALMHSLPGTKLIGKGNHDFWWTTASKMYRFFDDNKFDTLKILYNNSFVVENTVVCGSRGWFYDEKQQKTVGEVDYEKIVAREAQRLEISLMEAMKIKNENTDLPILVFLHFPPVYADCVCDKILDVLKKYNITNCYYGHIHNNYSIPRQFTYDSISFTMVAADYLNFAPMPIFI